MAEHLHDNGFPGESDEYRDARDALLRAEMALIEQIEQVAEMRRALPPGGPLKEDYVFEQGADDFRDTKTVHEVRLSELFGDHDTLILINTMWSPGADFPCPACNSLADGYNATAAHLSARVAFALVTRALRIWDMEPQHLIMEITETSIMVNEDIAQQNLRQLSDTGVLLSIDDFGTGYSSYSYLQQLPVQEMKIDRSFITDLSSNTKNQHLVRSMIQLGRDFNMNVLAEGIESVEIHQQLVDMGCEYGQGFLISRPLPADRMIEWMDQTDWNRSNGKK